MMRVLIFSLLYIILPHISLLAQSQEDETAKVSIPLLASQVAQQERPQLSQKAPHTIETEAVNPLRGFQGHDTPEGVVLDWTTVTNKQETRILVERSWDGKRYQVIGEVLGLEEINAENRHRFTDKYPRPGVSYYRLWILDEESKEHFSLPISIERGEVK